MEQMNEDIKYVYDEFKLIKSNKPDILDEESDISAEKLFIKLYGEIFEKCNFYINLDIKKFVENLKKELCVSEQAFFAHEFTLKKKDIKSINYQSYFSCLVHLGEKNILRISGNRLTFYHSRDIDKAIIYNVISLAKNSKKSKKHKQKFYMVANSRHFSGFELEEFDVKPQTISIDENYNDDFGAIDKKAKEFLRTKGANGLILLHGKYGTGKTSYIRHLMGTVNKKFIFLPVNMMGAISSPGFLPFISQYKGSILVLEDCEDILKQRDSNIADDALVNLLNLGDGLLSDALSIKIICTFNTDLKNIDQAILRKGRLATRYEFKELEIDKMVNLCNKLGINQIPATPKTLAEIYNLGDTEPEDSFTKQKIGF